MTVEGVPQVGLDERAVKLETDSDTRLAQGRDNLQEEAIPPLIGAEEDAVYDQEDKGQRGRMSSLYSEIPKTVLKQGNTATTRVTPKGKSEKLAPQRKGIHSKITNSLFQSCSEASWVTCASIFYWAS